MNLAGQELVPVHILLTGVSFSGDRAVLFLWGTLELRLKDGSPVSAQLPVVFFL